jgi:pimeloyl-ACP methyl ester carboxylesterase
VPSDARTRIVDSDGVRLHVRTWARGQRGTLLIHGLASTSHIWDLVAPRLERLGLGAVAYDQRGHGRSAKPSSGYGFDRTTTDAAAVIRATGLRRPIVVGHSWGANVALELAVRRPRLVAGALLLDGGFASMRERFDWATAKAVLAPPAFGRITVGEFRKRIRTVAGRSIPVTPEVDAVFLSLVRVDREGLVHPRLTRANHLRILRSMWGQDTDDLLGRVRVPTLLVAARTSSRGPDADGFAQAKASAAATVRAIGGHVSFEWIEGVHDVPLQRPEAVARRIARFSRTTDPVRAGRS